MAIKEEYTNNDMKLIDNLGEVVILYTEEYIRTLGSDVDNQCELTGDELIADYKSGLKGKIEEYRAKLKDEQLNMSLTDGTHEQRTNNLLRSIFITYELIKIDQMIERRAL